MLSLVPTRVGMILIQSAVRWWLSACPHTRGDDPYQGSGLRG